MLVTGVELRISDPAFSASFWSRLFFFDRFVAESAGFLFLVIILINGNIFLRAISYLVVWMFITVTFVQIGAIYFGGEFLSQIAIDNMVHIEFFLTLGNLCWFALLLLLCVSFSFFIERFACRSLEPAHLASIAGFLLCLFFAGITSHNWISKETFQGRNELFRKMSMAHTSPVYSLYQTLFDKAPNIERKDFSKSEVKELARLGFTLNLSSKYPFIKEQIYHKPVQFIKKQSSPRKPNVILIFTEGLSARSINAYGSPHPGLTPNIDRLSNVSMRVTNYFNHTAASYRGLHGQLCSIFPKYGGVGGWVDGKSINGIKYLCLSHLFNARGYETVFLNAHDINSSYVDEMMYALNFKKVLNGNDLTKAYLANEPLKNHHSLSDQQFYRSLVGYLKERLHQKANNHHGAPEPLFLSLYTLETHAHMDIQSIGVGYKDGSNNTLNTIHNLDNAFGFFLDYFLNSPYADNTVLIFTTDHCHYMEKSFVKSVKDPHYQKLFIDRIPLIIFDRSRDLPSIYDANICSSIDLAPTLTHYLQIPNQRNPFFGNSIFEGKDSRHKNMAVANYGSRYFLIDKKKIYNLQNTVEQKPRLQLIRKFIILSHRSEEDNAIWGN